MGELDIDMALAWRGRTVVDRAGEKIGTLRDIYLDENERPHWGSVRTGLFGGRETLVPLDQARPEDDVLRLPFDEQRVKDAPTVDPDVQLTEEEEQLLFRHYEIGSAPGPSDEVGAVAAGQAEPASQPKDAMTRSEEEVRIRKRARERGRARLRKYVVTDYVEKKVPVQREEVRVEYEPTHDPDRADAESENDNDR
jgi:sporulation protein YlmC with PRC-barrel domain